MLKFLSLHLRNTLHHFNSAQMPPLFIGNNFIIKIDQKSLNDLMTQVVRTPDQHCYLTELLGYDYDIIYRSGKENRVAYGLSLLEQPPQLFSMLLSFPSFEIIKHIKIENNTLLEL